MNRFPRWLPCIGVVLAAALAAPHSVRAEPYFAVQKGMHCSSCHSHPGGGGLRVDYGNAFSQTELPVTRIGNNDRPLWTGDVNDWLAVGANLRGGFEFVDIPDSDEVSEFKVNRGNLYVEANLIPGRLSVYVDQ